MRGTLLNTAAVITGSAIGLISGNALSTTHKSVALAAIGLVTLGFGIKMFLESKNVLVPMVSLVVGGLLGVFLGVDSGIENLADWVRQSLGGGGKFNEGLISASVLFCVGPMTLLGCLKDGLERDFRILTIKSALDFVASMFLAVSLGIGVLVSSVVVLVTQGSLTLLAKPLKPMIDHPAIIAEASATGGLILIAIGANLTGFSKIPTELFIPSLFIAPALSAILEKYSKAETPTLN